MTKTTYITANMVLLLGLSTSVVYAQTSQRETAVEPLSTAKFVAPHRDLGRLI